LGQGQPVRLKEALISVGIQFYKKSLNVSPIQRSDILYASIETDQFTP